MTYNCLLTRNLFHRKSRESLSLEIFRFGEICARNSLRSINSLDSLILRIICSLNFTHYRSSRCYTEEHQRLIKSKHFTLDRTERTMDVNNYQHISIVVQFTISRWYTNLLFYRINQSSLLSLLRKDLTDNAQWHRKQITTNTNFREECKNRCTTKNRIRKSELP